MREKIVDAFLEWIKPRTIFTFLFFTTFLNLILSGIEVHPALNTIISTLFGFWFGQKANKKEGT